MFDTIPIRKGYERIEVIGNLWADIELNTGWIDKFIGCIDILKNPKNRRKVNEIIRCEIKRIKRQNQYRKMVSPN